MKTIRYILFTIVATSAIVALAVFSKDSAQSSMTNSSNGSSEQTSAFIDKDQVFALIDNDEYTIGRLLDKDIAGLERDIYDSLQERLLAIYEANHYEANQDYEPSDAEIENFYEQNELKAQGSLDFFADRIKLFLIDNRKSDALKEAFSQSIDAKKVQFKVKLPQKLITFKHDIEAFAGNGSSDIALIEFSDMQCPFCRQVQPTLDRLVADYGQQVGFYFRHFPLSFHQQAEIAGIASECAAEQNQFRAYKKILFANQSKLFKPDLLNYADQVASIDKQQFSKCLNEEKYKQKVADDLKLGYSLGISGTPTIFVGKIDRKNKSFSGEVLVGAQPYDEYQQVIKRFLAHES